MSSITGRLIKGSMWLSLSRAVVNGLATLSTFVLARYLAPSDFGLVALATTMLMIVTTVTELSLAQALIHHEAPQESHFSAAWTLNAGRGLILCLFLAACAYPASAVYDDPRLVGVMIALGVSVFLSSLTNPRLVMLQRELIFWQEFVLNVSQKFTGFVASVAIAVIYHSYWALVIGTLVSQVANVLTSYLVLPFRPRITFRHTREFFSFSAWLAASQIINTLNWRFDYLLIGKVLGGSALGYYTVGSRLARMPSREATLPLTQTIFPSFASIRDDPRRLAAAYQRVQALVSAVALPPASASRRSPIRSSGSRSARNGRRRSSSSSRLLRSTRSRRWVRWFSRSAWQRARRASFSCATRRCCWCGSRSSSRGLLLYGMPGVIYGRVFTGLLGAFVNMLLVQRFIGLTVLEQLSANLRALTSVAVMAAGVSLASSYLPPAAGNLALTTQLAVLVTLGALLYCGSTLLLWLLMKRPVGPETEILTIAGKILTKVRLA